MPRPCLDLTDSLVKGHRTLYVSAQFLIADSLHGLRVKGKTKVQEVADFVNPALFYHDVDSFFDTGVQNFPRQAKADDIGVIDEVMSLALTDEGFTLALLDGADQSRQAVSVGEEFVPVRRLPIRSFSDIVFEASSSSLLTWPELAVYRLPSSARPESRSLRGGTGRRGPYRRRGWESSLPIDFGNSLTCHAAEFSSRIRLIRVGDID